MTPRGRRGAALTAAEVAVGEAVAVREVAAAVEPIAGAEAAAVEVAVEAGATDL